MIMIYSATSAEVRDLILEDKCGRLDEVEMKNMDEVLRETERLYIGTIKEDIVCAWGLAPTTLMSDRAYLWLYHTEKVKSHEFIFIRYSKMLIEDMLTEYPSIVGKTAIENKKAIKWISWLGGKFVGQSKTHLTFEIKRKVQERDAWLTHSL